MVRGMPCLWEERFLAPTSNINLSVFQCICKLPTSRQNVCRYSYHPVIEERNEEGRWMHRVSGGDLYSERGRGENGRKGGKDGKKGRACRQQSISTAL